MTLQILSPSPLTSIKSPTFQSSKGFNSRKRWGDEHFPVSVVILQMFLLMKVFVFFVSELVFYIQTATKKMKTQKHCGFYAEMLENVYILFIFSMLFECYS